MKIKVTKSIFRDAFVQAGRKDQFSYSALGHLFDYLEESDCGGEEEMELDPIAICCDFCEYSSAIEAAKSYDWEADQDSDEEENEESALEYLQERTQVISLSPGVIIANF